MILKITGITLSVNWYSQIENRAGRPDVLYFVRYSSSECLLKFDNQDVLLVGGKSCTDKKNTPYNCPDAFYELAVLLMDGYGLPEAKTSPTEALRLFQEIYKLVVDACH